MPTKTGVDIGEKYYHVRIRQPSRFSIIRIPKWAKKVANSVSKGAQVKMGKVKKSKEWKVQSVMITRKHHSSRSARRMAHKIVKKIEK